MGIQDKVSGRLKQAAGDLTGDEELRREGVREERKGQAKQELREAQEQADRKRAEVAQLEHETDPDTASYAGSRADRDSGERSEDGAGAGSDPRPDSATDVPSPERR